MRYSNPRTRPTLGGAYLYGSALQESGVGPFTLTSSSAGPYPQWWRYIGTDPVTLTLPDLSTYTNRAFLYALQNSGSGGASVAVEDDAGNPIVTIAVGESVLIGWDEALLTYDVIGTWSAGGGSVGPGTPNVLAMFDGAGTNVVDAPAFDNGFELELAAPLLAAVAAQVNEYLDLWTDADAGNSLNIEGRDSTLATVYGSLLLAIVGTADNWFIGTVQGDAAILPQAGTGGGNLHIGSGNAAGGVAEMVIREDGSGIDVNVPMVMGSGQQVSGKPQYPTRFVTNVNATIDANTDQVVVVVITSGVGRTATLPLITAAMVGRSYTIANRTPSGSSAAVTIAATGGQTISGGTSLGQGIAWTYYAIETSAGVYEWIREQ